VPAAEQRTFAVADAFDLRAALDVLVRRWRVVAVVAAVALVVALGLSLKQDKEYVAESEILVDPQATDSVLATSSEIYASAVNATRNLNNEVKALQAGVTRDAVAKAYNGPLDPDDVKISISDSASDIAEVSVRATDPKAAAALVNTYVEVASQFRGDQRSRELEVAREKVQGQLDDLETKIAQIRQPLTDVENELQANPANVAAQARRDDLAQSLASRLTPLEASRSSYEQQLENLQLAAGFAQAGGSAQVLTKADVPTNPVAPKPLQNAILGLVVGLLLGVVTAFIRDNLDERIRGNDDLERAAPGLPTLAVVPESRSTTRGYVAMRDDRTSMVAEAYRSLRTSVKFAGFDNPLKVIQITSALQGEGKTTSVANLAEALAQGGDRVAVVCCDLRRPAVHHDFRQKVTPGFTDVLMGDATLAVALRQVSERIYLLPAGSPCPNPSELLSSARTTAVIEALAAEFDVVLLDSTPILPVTDALVTSRFVDSCLMVVDTRTTKRKVLRHALQRLEQVAAPVTGLVLVGTAGITYGYGYSYSYAYEPDGAGGRRPEGQQVATPV
jgi:receptor protein-tyrosine kinase